MNLIVALFGAFVLFMALVALIVPMQLRNALLGWSSRKRFYAAILIRLVVGVLFLLAAPATRFPMAIYILGGIMIIAAVVLALMGQPKMDAMIERMLPRKSSVVRLYALVAILFGAFLIYAGM